MSKGKVAKEEFNKVIGVCLSIDTPVLRSFADDTPGKEKIDICIRIDEEERNFTLDEFKQRLGFIPPIEPAQKNCSNCRHSQFKPNSPCRTCMVYSNWQPKEPAVQGM